MRSMSPEQVLAIAEAIYSGLTNDQLRERFNAAERTVRDWRKDSRIKTEVENLKKVRLEATKAAIAKDSEEEFKSYLDELRGFRTRRLETAIALQMLAAKAIKPLKKAIETLDGDDLNPNQIAQIGKMIVELIKEGAAAEAEFLGIKEVIKKLDEQSDRNEI